MTTLLDGAIGTELQSRGVKLSDPGWTAYANRTHPHVLSQIHADYASAGATVHTANTFRTTQAAVGADWGSLAQQAVQCARAAVPSTHKVAGALAPVHDCYRPDLSPKNAEDQHRATAKHLANCGVDILLCETFANPQEALAASRAALRTGLEVWLALCPGIHGDLMTPNELADVGHQAARLGVDALLVNCLDATHSHPFLQALQAIEIKLGVYANAGPIHGGLGWGTNPDGPTQYAALAHEWSTQGAQILGGCCGTGPQHIRAIAERLKQCEKGDVDPRK